MSRDLNLKVLLAFADKVSGPLKKITGGSASLGKEFKETREKLKKLENQQKDLKGFRELHKSARDNAQALQQQQARVNALAKELAKTEKPTKKLTTEFKRAQQQSSKLKAKYQDQQHQLQSLRNQLSAAGISTKNLSAQERRLKQDIAATNQRMATQQKHLERLAQLKRKNEAINKRHGITMTHTAMMGGTGYASMAVGQNILNRSSQVLMPGINFGDQMSELQAVSRLNKMSEAFQRLKQQARDLGATTAFTATDVGAGQTFLARAGFSAQAIQASMPDMLAMAIANNTELARTADIASNIAGAFKINPEVAGNMTRVADVLSGTAARANVDLEMLGETMKYLGGAEDLKLTLEQAAAMTGLLGNIGIQGSQAGTTLRAMMNRLTAPAKLGRKAMASIGLQVKDTNGNLRAMPDILRDINNATKTLGNAERKRILQHIFGAEAGSGMNELVGQMSDGGLDKLLDELQNLQGENARMAKIRADNIGGDIKSLRSAWEDIGISITDTNEGPLRDFINRITGIVRGIGSWVKQNPELTATIAKVVAIVGVLAAVGGSLLIVLASIIGPISMVAFAFAKLRLALMAGSTLLSAFSASTIPLLLSKLKLLGAVLMSTPIGWTIAGIAAVALAATLIYKYWGPIKAFFTGVWMGLKESMGPAITQLQSALAIMWKFSPVRKIWELLSPIIRKVWNWLSQLITPLQSTGEGFDKAANWGRSFGQVLGNLVTFLPNLISSFISLGSRIVDGLISGITAKFAAVKSTITNLGNNTVNWFKEKLGIHSPSRVFASLGDHTMAGLAQGLNRSQKAPMNAVREMAGKLAKTGVLTAGLTVGTGAIAFDNRPPLGPRGGQTIIQGDTITIEINAPQGANPADIARAVNQALEERSRQKHWRRRSSLYDNE